MNAEFELGLAQRYSRADVEWLVETFDARVTDIWNGEPFALSRRRDGRCSEQRADPVMSDLVPSAIARFRGTFLVPLHIEMADILVVGMDERARFFVDERTSALDAPSPFEGKTITSLERVLVEARSELGSNPQDPEGLAAFVVALERARELGMAVRVAL